MLFDMRGEFISDLSRRLRDGVSLENEVVLLQGRLAATNPHQSRIAGAKGRPPKNACADVI
jgi:hypothetical protein